MDDSQDHTNTAVAATKDRLARFRSLAPSLAPSLPLSLSFFLQLSQCTQP
jgi:hypothetical protein